MLNIRKCAHKNFCKSTLDILDKGDASTPGGTEGANFGCDLAGMEDSHLHL